MSRNFKRNYFVINLLIGVIGLFTELDSAQAMPMVYSCIIYDDSQDGFEETEFQFIVSKKSGIFYSTLSEVYMRQDNSGEIVLVLLDRNDASKLAISRGSLPDQLSVKLLTQTTGHYAEVVCNM